MRENREKETIPAVVVRPLSKSLGFGEERRRSRRTVSPPGTLRRSDEYKKEVALRAPGLRRSTLPLVVEPRSLRESGTATPTVRERGTPRESPSEQRQCWANEEEVPRPIERRKRAMANDGAETKLSPQQPPRRPRRRLAGARWAGALIAGVCRLCRHYSNLKIAVKIY